MVRVMDIKNCIFCKIIAKEIPSDIILENDDILVIKDLHPKAPIHYLIIPKKHIVNIKELHDADLLNAAQIMIAARELSRKLSGDGSFRLIMNNGADSGQSVFHMHCHFLSGKKMLDF
ncbi:MAG: Diadenosine tetraphosphate (Ap4A) hydrolase and other HIT family hydrolase [candidate division TM6 bacterium GW2011_GWF2_32_72]|nr:MAG: Diadenosine tetraphosphate (Ap4A) hydrolase and other HIT family hydrolase [candidate division TM6 bacterium GW2011_GWF2_32_72]